MNHTININVVKKYLFIQLIFINIFFIQCLLTFHECHASLSIGKSLPCLLFRNKYNKTYDLCKDIKKNAILYFFDIESKPCQEGLMRLLYMREDLKKNGFEVIPVANSSKDIKMFLSNNMSIYFEKKSGFFDRLTILPTIYIINANREIIGLFQGQTYSNKSDILKITNEHSIKKRPAPKEISQVVECLPKIDHVRFYEIIAILNASIENYKLSIESYIQSINKAEQMLRKDNKSCELWTGIGSVFESMQEWGQANKMYSNAAICNNNDQMALYLEKRSYEKMRYQSSLERKKRIDIILKELENRYRKNNSFFSTIGRMLSFDENDEWTSKPKVVSFIIYKTDVLPVREGFFGYFIELLSDKIEKSGQIEVVERSVFDELLNECKIGSLSIANKNSKLRCDKIKQSIFKIRISFLLNQFFLRFIETETTVIKKVFSQKIHSWNNNIEINKLTEEILNFVNDEYPLQGYLGWAVDTNDAIINLGSKSGVQKGDIFDVINFKYLNIRGSNSCMFPFFSKPKIGSLKKKNVIAQVKVISVEQDFSFVKVIKNNIKNKNKMYKIIKKKGLHI